MEYKSLNRYFLFGTCVRFLQDAAEGAPIHTGTAISYNLESMFAHLELLGASVTLRLAENLFGSLRSELLESAEDAKLTADQAVLLRSSATSLRRTLQAELDSIGAYVLSPKRLDVKWLVDSPERFFAPGVFEGLPAVAQHDMREAGKCIAFERATAAAFHLMRATEATLRCFYEKMIRQSRIREPRMWGPILADLRIKNATKNHTTLINHLDHIRSAFRNPTQHPDATYDVHEAQDLWSVCAEVINRMIKILRAEKRIT